MPVHRVLLVGDYDHRDFAGLTPWLRQRAEVVGAANIEEAVEHIAPPAAPADLCLFVQARPGGVRQEHVERIHRLAPLARMATVLGVWCEGEARTGDPLTGVVRIYWHEWAPRLRSLWDSPGNADSAWRLPRTASPAERTLVASARDEPSGLFAIRTRSAASFRSLADALRAAGHGAVWLHPRQTWRVQGATALIWEGDVRLADDLQELKRLAASLQPAPTIALLGFPRPEDQGLALSAGAAAVVAKPYLLDDVLQRLNDARA